MDNADNNNKMTKFLEKLLTKQDIKFNHQDWHIWCLSHILNICSGHVLDALTDKSIIAIASSCFSAPPEDLDNRQTYRKALKSDPISLGCNIVNILCASRQQHDQFEDYIREGNKAGYWNTEDENGIPSTGKKVEIIVLQLLCNMKTQWDSVYYMICHLCYLQQVRISTWSQTY